MKGAMTNCHVILSLHWRPCMMSHLDTYWRQNGLSHHITISLKPTNDIPNEIPFGYLSMSKWFVMSYYHFIETHKWHPKWDPIWIPIDVKMVCRVILPFHWNPQMTSQMRSHLETVPIDLKPFFMPNCHFIETHKWHPKWSPIWRLYL